MPSRHVLAEQSGGPIYKYKSAKLTGSKSLENGATCGVLLMVSRLLCATVAVGIFVEAAPTDAA